jgi:hypothetical protein
MQDALWLCSVLPCQNSKYTAVSRDAQTGALCIKQEILIHRDNQTYLAGSHFRSLVKIVDMLRLSLAAAKNNQ